MRLGGEREAARVGTARLRTCAGERRAGLRHHRIRRHPLNKAAGDYGAVYFPWVYGIDPIGAGRNPSILLPPSGFVAGIYARTDNSRGVFKAPAGNRGRSAGAGWPRLRLSATPSRTSSIRSG